MWSGRSTSSRALRRRGHFLPLIVFWITLATIHIILLRWLPYARWHGAVQVISDVIMVSALVYATGLQDSYFVSLYLLVIIVASILFSRGLAFTTAAVCVASDRRADGTGARRETFRGPIAACTRRKDCDSGF